MKICKQCNRTLDEKEFRPVKSRSKGIRASEPGTRAVCRCCERVLTQAYGLLKDLDAGRSVDEAKLDRVLSYYKGLMQAGCRLTHSAAQRLVGLYSTADEMRAAATRADDDSIAAAQHLGDLYKHIEMLRARSYSSFDDADMAHHALVPRLREAGLYEEANNLIDDWFFEEE